MSGAMSRTGTRALKRLLLLVEMVACIVMSSLATAQQPKQSATNGGAVQTEMRNVMYHFTEQVNVHILTLDGRLLPQKESNIPIFGDPNSFTLAIDSAEISMHTDALTNVLNQYVLAAPDSPIKDVDVTIRGSFLMVKGKLHSKGDVPFETEGTIEPRRTGKFAYRRRRSRPLRYLSKGLWISSD